MRQFAVTLPVAGSIVVFVDAETEEEALSVAFEQQDWRVETGDNTEAGEFETMKHIARGNVCYAPCISFEVEES